MITNVCNIIAVAAYAATGIWYGVGAIRARRELAVLREVKSSRRAGRPDLVDGVKPHLLWLLEQTEKHDLLTAAPVLAKWLGTTPVSDIGAYDAAYYAGCALQGKATKNLHALFGATGGSALMGVFATSWLQAGHIGSSSSNVLQAMGESALAYAKADWPLLLSMLLLGWSWREKERADQLAVEADILETHAQALFARETV